MPCDKRLRFFLEPSLRASAMAGGHNFIGKLASVLKDHGFQIEYCADDDDSVALAARDDGHFSLFHMRQPVGRRALVFRRVYHYPFWAIEPSSERWNWHVARSHFDPESIDPNLAESFARFWRKKLFGRPNPCPKGEGFLYIPLQGRLTQHRSFQSCSPIDMIEKVLLLDARPVIVGLHPKESYTAEDYAALERLSTRYPRLTLKTGGMETYLPACDAVVTQNSSVAFNGFFLGKPAVLFAQIDFHHIAVDALTDPEAAFAKLPGHAPDYQRYLFWFWQIMSINAGKPEASDSILRALHRANWPVT
jgi:hypothetical protein